ncbi:hypothetical protein BpHYR1_047954 [Brachionus plicatilis]|uniref:Uncharacterized protein n=1 Tax=Brachionus plicatilis TaxID=10195 RepID=A0A3M7S0N8_BRAPC|nr:hypothetical protein BpHYR1_047954 [Brachionus plicatilis]
MPLDVSRRISLTSVFEHLEYEIDSITAKLIIIKKSFKKLFNKLLNDKIGKIFLEFEQDQDKDDL